MATVYYEKDANRSDIQDKVIGIIGYGSQGHAHPNDLIDQARNARKKKTSKKKRKVLFFNEAVPVFQTNSGYARTRLNSRE